MSKDIKFVASQTVMDPAAGPLHVMVFHVATAYADDVDEKFEAIKGMGVFVKDPQVMLHKDINFVRIFHLNRCFTEREVLVELGISISPILDIIEFSPDLASPPSVQAFPMAGVSESIVPMQQPLSIRPMLLAVSDAPLHVKGVYEYDDQEYRVSRGLSEFLYEVELKES